MIIKYLDAQWCGSGPTAVHNGKMLIFCLKTSFISEFKTLLQAKYKSFWFLSFYFNQTYMDYVQIKVGYVSPLAISSEFRLRQYRDGDYRENALHFINFNGLWVVVTFVRSSIFLHYSLHHDASIFTIPHLAVGQWKLIILRCPPERPIKRLYFLRHLQNKIQGRNFICFHRDISHQSANRGIDERKLLKCDFY